MSSRRCRAPRCGGGRGPKSRLQGKQREDGQGPGQGVLGALQRTLPEGGICLREGHRRRSHLPLVPRKPPREVTHDQRARASVQGGQEEDEGGGGLPRRDEREHASYGDRLEKQRRVDAKALPHHGRPRSGRETQPTTFETLTKDHVWSYDFVMDLTEDGRRLKMMPVVDEYTRECLSIDV